MQVPLRKTNINGGISGRRVPPVPDDQTRFTGIGSNTNAINSSYPQHPHLMTTLNRNNGADGFTTTSKPGLFSSNNNATSLFIISISIKYIINLIIYVSWSANKTKDGSFVGKRDAPCGQARVFNKLLHPKNIQPPTTTGTNINSLEKSGHSSASAGFNYQPPHSTSLLVASLRSPGSDRLVNKEILLVSYCSDAVGIS